MCDYFTFSVLTPEPFFQVCYAPLILSALLADDRILKALSITL